MVMEKRIKRFSNEERLRIYGLMEELKNELYEIEQQAKQCGYNRKLITAINYAQSLIDEYDDIVVNHIQY